MLTFDDGSRTVFRHALPVLCCSAYSGQLLFVLGPRSMPLGTYTRISQAMEKVQKGVPVASEGRTFARSFRRQLLGELR